MFVLTALGIRLYYIFAFSIEKAATRPTPHVSLKTGDKLWRTLCKTWFVHNIIV